MTGRSIANNIGAAGIAAGFGLSDDGAAGASWLSRAANGSPLDRVSRAHGGRALAVADLARIVAGLPLPASPGGLIDEIRELADLNAALAARQARNAVIFSLSSCAGRPLPGGLALAASAPANSTLP